MRHAPKRAPLQLPSGAGGWRPRPPTAVLRVRMPRACALLWLAASLGTQQLRGRGVLAREDKCYGVLSDVSAACAGGDVAKCQGPCVVLVHRFHAECGSHAVLGGSSSVLLAMISECKPVPGCTDTRYGHTIAMASCTAALFETTHEPKYAP